VSAMLGAKTLAVFHKGVAVEKAMWSAMKLRR
jgi:hypothetical protein